MSILLKSDSEGRQLMRQAHLRCTIVVVVVVVVVVNGSYSAAPLSSPDRECITKSQLIKITTISTHSQKFKLRSMDART